MIEMKLSADEIMRLLERANALRASFFKVSPEGFEVAWEPEPHQAPAPNRFPEPAPAKNVKRPVQVRQGVNPVRRNDMHPSDACPDCGEPVIAGKWGRPYCVGCYKREKNSDQNR